MALQEVPTGPELSTILGPGYHITDFSRSSEDEAQGMVMVQLGVSAEEALGRLRAYAYAHERRLGDVADDVICRRISMERDGP